MHGQPDQPTSAAIQDVVNGLHAADRKHELDIANLRNRLSELDDDIDRHETHIDRLDSVVNEMRITLGLMSTKDDISALREDISERFDRRTAEAHASVPLRTANIFAAGMFLIAFATLVLVFIHSH
jgi:hypothetical protein